MLDYLPSICARGWKAVVAAPGAGPLFDAARKAGAETEKIPLGHYADGRKTTSDAVQFVFDTARLRNSIAQNNSDLIVVGGARTLLAAALSAPRRKVVFYAEHFFEEARALQVAGWAIHSFTSNSNSGFVNTALNSLNGIRTRTLYITA